MPESDQIIIIFKPDAIMESFDVHMHTWFIQN
jgi:hypothetical protein